MHGCILRHDVLTETVFQGLECSNANFFAVVEFMADETKRLSVYEWNPRFVIQTGDANIDIRVSTSVKEWPNYEFDPVNNPKITLHIHKQITLRQALDAVCEKAGFHWQSKGTYIQMFKR